MIHFVHDKNILNSDATALVNGADSLGRMGSGLAAQFRLLYPEMFEQYRELCANGALEPGDVQVYNFTDEKTGNNRYILNVIVKKGWRFGSPMDLIDACLRNIRDVIIRNNIDSLAMATISFTTKENYFGDIERHMGEIFNGLQNCNITVYSPV